MSKSSGGRLTAATSRMRAASASEEPPNFMTTFTGLAVGGSSPCRREGAEGGLSRVVLEAGTSQVGSARRGHSKRAFKR